MSLRHGTGNPLPPAACQGFWSCGRALAPAAQVGRNITQGRSAGQEMGSSKPGTGCPHWALTSQSCPPKPGVTLQQSPMPGSFHMHHNLENPLIRVSRCRCMKVQGQDFAKVHPFMVHKGLPRPGGSAAPRGEAPGAMGCSSAGQEARAEPSLPWKGFAPKQSIAFFKTCYKPSAQPQRHIPMAPVMLRGAEGLQHLAPN